VLREIFGPKKDETSMNDEYYRFMIYTVYLVFFFFDVWGVPHNLETTS
jgi:hypothetical protein